MRCRFLSWNVNGIRSIERKGFLSWLAQESPDIIGIQETKAHSDQVSDDLLHPHGYTTYWSHAERKGYSGVALYSKMKPRAVSHGIGIKEFDREGRTLILEFPQFYFLNVYFPNGNMNAERLSYKLTFYDAFLTLIASLQSKGKTIIICGDVNTAHQEIDLARPKENANVSGFLPKERAWIDCLLQKGFIDTFRAFHNEGGQYTWWDFKTRARERNVGWRLDYFFIDKQSRAYLKDAFILKDVLGSDHCPIGITLEI